MANERASEVSEMIERVARALSRACWDGCEEEGVIEPCRPDLCPCRRAARAAIEAMREPTEAMVITGLAEYVSTRLADPNEPAGKGVAHIWRAMIDAALRD